MEDCIFCRIIDRQIPAYIIDETHSVITFLSLENHPLVVPKAHIPNIYALDDALGGAVMREAIAIAKAVKAGLGCEGVYLAQANEPAAGQDVFHFHLHVYPRWHGDGMKVSEPEHDGGREAKQRTMEQIRAALSTTRSGLAEG